MRTFIGKIALALFCFQVCYGGIQAQQTAEHPTVTRHSPHAGLPVTHPEALSGVWETPNGSGGAVGIGLRLMTTVPGTARTLAGVTQSWDRLDVGVFERKGAEIKFGDENFFPASVNEHSVTGGDGASPDGYVTFEAGHLRLHFNGNPAVDLDLVQGFNEWFGRLHRDAFDSIVTLRRPAVGSPAKISPILGTWHGTSLMSNRCIHIFQPADGKFTGWSDSLQVGSPFGIQPATLVEMYGELARVSLDNDNDVSIEFNAFSGICCPHKFVGKLSADGARIEGSWPPGPNQTPHTDSLEKMPADSCIE